MAKHPSKYWLILAGLWGAVTMALGVVSALYDAGLALFLYILASLGPVGWFFHKLAQKYSRGLFSKKMYEKAKAIIEDMEDVHVPTLSVALDITYEETCRLLAALEREDFLTPRRLKFPGN